MRRLQLVVEGQTEEILAESLLVPHLSGLGWVVGKPVIVRTKTVRDGANHKGGMTTWAKVRPQITQLLRSFDLVTTLFDYYGFPTDAPGMAGRPRLASGHARAAHVERALADDIADPKFVPHLMVHETEALVFAARRQLDSLFPGRRLNSSMRKMVDDAGGPELVNDSPMTAPSKRLERLIPGYSKVNDGPLAIIDCGLDALRAECPHFDAWLCTLEEASPSAR